MPHDRRVDSGPGTVPEPRLEDCGDRPPIAGRDPDDEFVAGVTADSRYRRPSRRRRLHETKPVQLAPVANRAAVAEAASRRELDETKRNALYGQADSIAFVEAPMVFLYFYNELYAVQPWIKHFVPPVIFNGQRWLDVTISTPKP